MPKESREIFRAVIICSILLLGFIGILWPIQSHAFSPIPALVQAGVTPVAEKAASAVKALQGSSSSEITETKTCLGTIAGIIPTLNLEACIADLSTIFLFSFARGLWIAGILFNFSIGFSLNMSAVLKQVPVVEIGWREFRDLANILFIFILLYIAIRIIIQGTGFEGGKFVVNLIIVALLINFSLFITKVVIDASNIMALHFYQKSTGQEFNWRDPPTYDRGLSMRVMNALRLQTAYKDKDVGYVPEGVAGLREGEVVAGSENVVLTFIRIATIQLLASVFIIITAFVFLAGSIFFALRTVILLFLMILSPLAFIAWVVPGLSDITKDFWSRLFKQAFFAPFYLALIYVVIETIDSPAFRELVVIGGKQTSFAAAFSGTGPGAVTIAFNFVLVIGFMLASLWIAHKFSAVGSKTVIEWAETAGKWGVKTGRGAVGYTGRETLGRLASRVSRSQKLRDYASKSPLVEAALQGLRKTGGGYEQKLEREIKRKTEFAEFLGGKEKFAYAGRIAKSVPVKVGSSLAGIYGRADRGASAQIFEARYKDLDSQVNQLNQELARLQVVETPTTPQLQRIAELTGTSKRSITYLKQQKDDLERQINTLFTSVEEMEKIVKQKY